MGNLSVRTVFYSRSSPQFSIFSLACQIFKIRRICEAPRKLYCSLLGFLRSLRMCVNGGFHQSDFDFASYPSSELSLNWLSGKTAVKQRRCWRLLKFIKKLFVIRRDQTLNFYSNLGNSRKVTARIIINLCTLSRQKVLNIN